MKYFYPLFILLYIISFKQAKAQYNGKTIITIDKQEGLNEKKVDSILNTITIKDSVFAQIAHDFSYFFYKQKKEYDLAIKYGVVELNTLNNLNLINKNHTNALYNIGKFYLFKKQYNKAITYSKKAIKSNASTLKVAQSYCQMGQCYFEIGDYYKSVNNYRKGISLLEKLNYKATLIGKYNNLANVCNKVNTPETTEIGLYYLKKADSTARNTPNFNISDNSMYSLNAGFANLYALKHQYNFKKAKYYYSKNLNKAITEKNNRIIANSYLNIGELYLKAKKDSSIYFLKKSIAYDSVNKIDIYETYRNTANYYQIKQQYQKALTEINKSLTHSFDVENYPEIKHLSIKQLLNTNDKISITTALKTKTEILISLYKSTNNKDFLYKAINTVNFNDKLVELLLDFSTETSTKLLWRKEASKTYILGVKAAHILQDDALEFHFMEKNRALLLIQSIQQNIAQRALPDNLRNKKLELKQKILKLEEGIINKNKDSSIYSKEKDSLFNLKEAYTIFNDSINKLYPNYLTDNLKQISLEEIKKSLDNNTMVISYISSTTEKQNASCFGIAISNKNQYSFEIKNINKLINDLNTFKNSISKPLKTKTELESYQKNAYSLYNQLFPGDNLKQVIRNKHLIIIPAIAFQNIPFEALNTDKKSLKYLIENNDISYTYSMSFLHQNKAVKRNTTKDFIGFAPVEFNTKSLTTLVNTEQEIQTINNILEGEAYTYDDSNKATFLKRGLNSKIIHLATHANSSQTPEIYFKKDTLKLHELYTLKNNADLVVLSACETNLGEIKKGEGVFSLARGFFYSGSNTVISSLWNINDTSTSFLMKNFYENLKNKDTKVKALNNAKRAYLNKHKLSEKSPYYWASFILIGNTDKTFENNYNYLYLLSIITILILFLIFYKKKG